jgi:hypothetical protein
VEPEPRQVLGIEELTRLDLLPRMRQAVKVGMVSSYDRTGGNDDGFSGTYSYIRKEPEGLVLAELDGPGIIYRIYTPTPTDDIIEFYFDGEPSPPSCAKTRPIGIVCCIEKLVPQWMVMSQPKRGLTTTLDESMSWTVAT